MTTGSVLAHFTITLSQAVSEQVAVEWHTADGTAIAGVDYAAAKGTVLFSPGQTAKTVEILVHGRAVGSEDRSFFVEMLPPTNAILGASIGECIIHVDATGSTPVTQIIVPTGPRGLQGDSAYQTWLDLGNTGTEEDFINSLKPSAEEIAEEVAPLIDLSNSPLTAEGTETLSKPDTITGKRLARRIAYVGAAKVATVVLADGDNLITHAALSGDAVDFSSVGFYPRIVRGSTVISPEWSVQSDGGLLIKQAVAGDVLYACQYDFVSEVSVKRMPFEALRRTYAEAGYNLVDGSFEAGGAVAYANDVLLYEATGVAYSYIGTLPYTIGAGETPDGNPLWVAKDYNTLRTDVSIPKGPIGAASLDEAKSILGTAPSWLPVGDYSLGTTAPDYTIAGPGRLVANGVITGGNESSYNPELEIFSNTPKDYQREHRGITYPPPPFATAPGAQKRHRTVHSLGSQLGDPEKLAGYVTAFGNYNGANFNQWFAVDAFGGDTLMYAYNVERTVAVGSEALAWFGAPSYDYLVQFRHDWFRKPGSNPYLPGDPLWNPNGLATIFPTLSAEIGNFTGYATSTADAGYTTVVGRDAGNHTIAGTNNTLIGYCSGQNLYAGSRNTAVGTFSLQSPIFATQIAAFGTEAGRYCKDSIDAVFVGHGAGRTVQNASSSVYVGARSGDGVIDGERAVIIGYEAGKGHASLNDVLSISNNSLQFRKPLIGGKFDSNYAGVNADPSLMRAKWHVRNADSGSNLTPAVGVLVEGEVQAAVTVETAANGFSSYRFATPAGVYLGGMEYSPASNSITFKTNSTSQVRIASDGAIHPSVTDNTQAIGKPSNRWSIVYAGTGTINTSDAREKTAPLPITDAIMDAIDSVDIVLYQWLSSIAEKGADNARWHFGAMAQSVRDAFAAQGLDGRDYGLLCYDEWKDEYEEHADEYEEVPAVTQEVDGEMVEITPAHRRLVKEAYTVQTVVAGNRWGLRPDQCMWLLAAAARRRAERAEDRLSNVEQRLLAAGI